MGGRNAEGSSEWKETVRERALSGCFNVVLCIALYELRCTVLFVPLLLERRGRGEGRGVLSGRKQCVIGHTVLYRCILSQDPQQHCILHCPVLVLLVALSRRPMYCIALFCTALYCMVPYCMVLSLSITQCCPVLMIVQWWEKSDWSGYKELGKAPADMPLCCLAFV